MAITQRIRDLSDAVDTVAMSTDELLANALAAMRWRDEVGESAVEIYCEWLALRFWEALNARLMCGAPIPVAWNPGINLHTWFGTTEDSQPLANNDIEGGR